MERELFSYVCFLYLSRIQWLNNTILMRVGVKHVSTHIYYCIFFLL